MAPVSLPTSDKRWQGKKCNSSILIRVISLNGGDVTPVDPQASYDVGTMSPDLTAFIPLQIKTELPL